MRCPACTTGEGAVLETRVTKLGIRRRRRCITCKHRWSTVEMDAGVVEQLARLSRSAAALRELFAAAPELPTKKQRTSLRVAEEVLREGDPKEWT